MDVILGTNALAILRDRPRRQGHNAEGHRLGVEHLSKAIVATMASTVPLASGGQALVVARLPTEVEEGACVLVEGLLPLDPSVRVARSLCTVREGRVLVEVCNASTEELLLARNASVAVVTEIPKSAFASEECKSAKNGQPNRVDVSQVIGAVDNSPDADCPREPIPGLKEAKEAEMEELDIDFTGSKLSQEQRALLAKELNSFRDLFVETSKTPGRTDLLEFSIDTGDARTVSRRLLSRASSTFTNG